MANRPLPTPLPADLPEDWADSQIVAPSGASVGLSEQHGYNYLMKMVNRAQQAANALNEGFDTVSGKRTCRVVVGTSTAGWTEGDCDYLCDGTDDQVEIQSALNAAETNGGGEVVLLSGDYQIAGSIVAPDRTVLTGNGMENTRLKIQAGAFINPYSCAITAASNFCIRDLYIMGDGSIPDSYRGYLGRATAAFGFILISGVRFSQVGPTPLISATGGLTRVINCILTASIDQTVLRAVGNCVVEFFLNDVYMSGEVKAESGGATGSETPSVTAIGNRSGNGFPIILSSAKDCIISNNLLSKVELGSAKNCLICGNSFSLPTGMTTCITLGEDSENNFVTGNDQRDIYTQVIDQIVDNGTGNVVRFNSADESGGGGAAGVSSFKGRTGAVVPQSGDYTAAMVGAVPTGAVTEIQSVTQAQYDALPTKGATTLYLIQG